MEDLVWKKKSTSVFRYFMLFGIRLAEVLIASIIPSVIGLVTVIITPKEWVMKIMENLSLFVFIGLNAIFWVRYVKHRENRKEFYIMNGVVYLLYALISVLTYVQNDVYLYSILFSNLRGLELIWVSTKTSLIVSHCILMITMIICEICSRKYYIWRVKNDVEERMLDAEIEQDETVPQQANEVITFLTVDEVNMEMEREFAEAAHTIEESSQITTDKNWDMEMVQGDNGEIVETTPYDPDNDIDSDDYVSEEYAREEMMETMNYDSDSLWNTEIYNGRERIYDYEDEEYSLEMFEDNVEFWGEDIKINEESLHENDSDGTEWPEYEDDNYSDLDYDDESEEYFSNSFEEYDSDNLWDEIKQGK